MHNNKYIYNKVNYKNASTKICIICPEHGEFWQTPNSHLNGCGCPQCAIAHRVEKQTYTIDKFKELANSVHKGKYDYSPLDYKNSKTKIKIICPEHGEFWQSPDVHLQGQGCPICGNLKKGLTRRITNLDFIVKSNIIHNNQYDYSKVDMGNRREDGKICIICPEHGEFWQTPDHHLRGYGCPQCGRMRIIDSCRKTNNKFQEDAKKVHGDKYDYSKVEYKNSSTKVSIICPEHGEFWQTPSNHLQGKGCPICGTLRTNLANTLTQEDFLCNAKKVHGGKYIYNKSIYQGNDIPIIITCPIHGDFQQTPTKHLNVGHGCPKCNSSRLEAEIRLLLQEQGINFEEQKRFDWLGLQSLDFYLPESHIAIECQGVQHYRPVHFFGGNAEFELTQQRDTKKKQLCESNEVKLIYYTHEDIIPDDATCFSQEALLEKITK